MSFFFLFQLSNYRYNSCQNRDSPRDFFIKLLATASIRRGAEEKQINKSQWNLQGRDQSCKPSLTLLVDLTRGQNAIAEIFSPRISRKNFNFTCNLESKQVSSLRGKCLARSWGALCFKCLEEYSLNVYDINHSI